MTIHFLLMFRSSCLRQLVVEGLPSLAQLQYRVAFARERRIHAHAGLGGHLAEEIGDAIARHAKRPARDVLGRHQQAVRFHQLVADVLQNVLGVAGVGRPALTGPLLILAIGRRRRLYCVRRGFLTTRAPRPFLHSKE